MTRNLAEITRQSRPYLVVVALRKLGASIACLVGRIVQRDSNMNASVPSSFCGVSSAVRALA